MTTPNDTSGALSARLAGLSPEKQALLARALAARASARGDGDRIVPRDDAGPAPLSYAQELLWLYEQMTPGTAAYNVPLGRRVRGPLDVPTLGRAFDAMVARHESLRTRFVEIDGVPRQEAVRPRPVAVEVHDLRAHAADTREFEAQRLVREIAARPFDLALGTEPRVAVVRLADEEAVLLVVVHHTVFDGGSIGVLLRELAVCYSAALAGTAATLAPLPIQLADYATWERRELGDARLAPEIAFWQEQLDGAPSAIELPTDFARTSGTTGPGARYATTLSGATRDAVRSLAASHEATPFMVLLAAFQAVLHRHSGQPDLVVGTPVAGRSRPGTEGLVGYLANTLPLRARFESDPTFAELLRQVRDGARRAFDHQDVPYEKLVRELRAGLPVAEQALFRAMFALQESSDASLRLGEATLEPLGVDLGAAKFDLTASAAEVPDGIRVAVEYRSDLFRPDTIARLVGHLAVLLGAAARAPGTRVSRLPLLTDDERRQLLWEWNDTAVEYAGGSTLVELLSAQAARTPDAVAVEDEQQRTLTYAELDAATTSLARGLRAAGVDRGVLVGVCAQRSVELVVALVSAVKAGGAYVPIDPEYPADRVAYMLADADARVLLTTVALAPTLPAHGAKVLLLDGAAGSWDTPLEPAPLADDPAYMIYTSGSTGQPKGALNAHHGIVNRLNWMQAEYGLTSDDVVLQKTPFSFDVSVWEFFWPLLSGARLVLARPGGHRDARYLADLIVSRGVTVCHFVPSMLREFLADPASVRCVSLRDVMASGEALAPDLVADFYATLPLARLHNLYGPTECAVDVSYWPCPPSRVPPAVVPIGRPVWNTRLYVLDASGEPTPIGVPGELHLGGVQVGLGYHNRPELTAERFVPDPFAPATEGPPARMYRTGDRARWQADGTVEYLGRLDFQVKLRGFRIELGEIEAALAAHPGVAVCVATIRTESQSGPRLVAYYVATGTPPLRAELRTWASARLPEFMVPSTFVELPALPLTSNGKVDRKALPDPAVLVDDTAPRIAPRTDVEHVLAGVWSEVLGVPNIDVESSFFEVGGHSLLAIRVVAQMTKIFRARLTLRAFFEEPTVAGVARALVAQEAKPGQTASIAALLRKLQSMSPEERESFRRRQTGSDQTSGSR